MYARKTSDIVQELMEQQRTHPIIITHRVVPDGEMWSIERIVTSSDGATRTDCLAKHMTINGALTSAKKAEEYHKAYAVGTFVYNNNWEQESEETDLDAMLPF